MIRTRRLTLIPATLELLSAELQSRSEFERALGVAVPDNWPPDLYDKAATEYTIAKLIQEPESCGW